jgi:hypothetical protein
MLRIHRLTGQAHDRIAESWPVILRGRKAHRRGFSEVEQPDQFRRTRIAARPASSPLFFPGVEPHTARLTSDPARLTLPPMTARNEHSMWHYRRIPRDWRQFVAAVQRSRYERQGRINN